MEEENLTDPTSIHNRTFAGVHVVLLLGCICSIVVLIVSFILKTKEESKVFEIHADSQGGVTNTSAGSTSSSTTKTTNPTLSTNNGNNIQINGALSFKGDTTIQGSLHVVDTKTTLPNQNNALAVQGQTVCKNASFPDPIQIQNQTLDAELITQLKNVHVNYMVCGMPLGKSFLITFNAPILPNRYQEVDLYPIFFQQTQTISASSSTSASSISKMNSNSQADLALFNSSALQFMEGNSSFFLPQYGTSKTVCSISSLGAGVFWIQLSLAFKVPQMKDTDSTGLAWNVELVAFDSTFTQVDWIFNQFRNNQDHTVILNQAGYIADPSRSQGKMNSNQFIQLTALTMFPAVADWANVGAMNVGFQLQFFNYGIQSVPVSMTVECTDLLFLVKQIC